MIDESKQPEQRVDGAEDKYSAFYRPTAIQDKKTAKKNKISRRTRTLLLTTVLAVVLAVAVLLVTLLPTATAGSSSVSGGDVSEPEASITLLDKTPADSKTVALKQVDITYDGNSYTILYNEKDKVYQLKGYEDLSLEPDGIEALSQALTILRVSDEVTAAEDATAFGLDKPVAIVTAAYHDGTTATLSVGKETPSGSGYYLSLKGKDTVYIAAEDTVYPFLASANDYVETTLLTTPAIKADDANGSPGLREVTLSGRSHPTPLTIRRRVAADGDEMSYYTYIIASPYKRGTAEPVSTALNAFISLEASQAAVLHPTDAQLKDMGFKNPLTKLDLTMSVMTTVSSAESDASPNDLVEFYNTYMATLTIGDKDENGNYLVMLDGIDAIFLVAADNLSMVAERNYDNTVADLLFLKDIREVGKIIVSTPENDYDFVLTHKKNETDTSQNLTVTEGDNTYNVDEFRDLYQLMMGIRRYDRLEKVTATSPDLTITIMDVDGTPYLAANFYADGPSLYQVRTTEGEQFLTKASNITHLIKQVNNLLEGKDVLLTNN